MRKCHCPAPCVNCLVKEKNKNIKLQDDNQILKNSLRKAENDYQNINILDKQLNKMLKQVTKELKKKNKKLQEDQMELQMELSQKEMEHQKTKKELEYTRTLLESMRNTGWAKIFLFTVDIFHLYLFYHFFNFVSQKVLKIPHF